MNKFLVSVALVALLAGCNGTQPFADDTVEPTEPTDPTDPTDPTTPEDPLSVGTRLPTGVSEPQADDGITRLEATGDGGGLVSTVRYVESRDRFIVDGLGFDGANRYRPGRDIGSLNGYSIFEANPVTEDDLTGDRIDQITPYRALVGVSDTTLPNGDPRTSFAIVRTGGYVGYGFGGFLYERNGSVVLPDTGQAVFSGDYAGVRVFDGRGGLEYTTGDMEMAVDFSDFDTNDAVRGNITNRRAFDIDGTEITLGGDDDALVLPTLRVVIQAGEDSLLENGEMTGEMSSFTTDDSGNLVPYEEGNYYAVIAGDTTRGDGGEIVGVVVVTSQDPRYNIEVQETGGFILTRGASD